MLVLILLCCICFLPECWGVFLFPPKKWNFIPWYRTGSICIGGCFPPPLPVIFPQLSVEQRMFEDDVTFPLQSFNKRRWIGITMQLLQKEESWARKGRAHSNCVASRWLRRLLLLLKQSVGCSHACVSLPDGGCRVPVDLNTWSIINLVTNSAKRQSEVVLLCLI